MISPSAMSLKSIRLVAGAGDASGTDCANGAGGFAFYSFPSQEKMKKC